MPGLLCLDFYAWTFISGLLSLDFYLSTSIAGLLNQEQLKLQARPCFLTSENI